MVSCPRTTQFICTHGWAHNLLFTKLLSMLGQLPAPLLIWGAYLQSREKGRVDMMAEHSACSGVKSSSPPRQLLPRSRLTWHRKCTEAGDIPSAPGILAPGELNRPLWKRKEENRLKCAVFYIHSGPQGHRKRHNASHFNGTVAIWPFSYSKDTWARILLSP